MNTTHKEMHILLAGNEKLSLSICVCLLQAGYQVTLIAPSVLDKKIFVDQDIVTFFKLVGKAIAPEKLNIVSRIDPSIFYNMVIAITKENTAEKKALIEELEINLSVDTLIAINTESIALSTLQQQMKHPERLIGANWAEPVHTTYFLELITNATTNRAMVENFYYIAKEFLHKDPYVVTNDNGIRSRMLCALIREAFYLIENNYVTVEDIDRACRNDAGYYLPFAGNFRYMDLMGAYMYGVVMQDLNPELSKNTHIPKFCQDLIDQGAKGMATGKGFYEYAPGEAVDWAETFWKFSYEIEEIISKYPFNYQQETRSVIPAALS